MLVVYFFFFFHAEDGIRDGHVTGVQTCALPIFLLALRPDRLAWLGVENRDVDVDGEPGHLRALHQVGRLAVRADPPVRRLYHGILTPSCATWPCSPHRLRTPL